MDATNKLRFVQRSAPMHLFYKTMDAQGNLVQATQTFMVLQQWWEEKQWAHEDYIEYKRGFLDAENGEEFRP